MQDVKTPYLNPAWLWFGMIGAPVVWALHFYFIWAVDEMGCGLGIGTEQYLSPPVVRILFWVSTILAVGLIIASALVSYRNYRRLEAAQRPTDPEHVRAMERGRFMAVVGMGFSVTFLLVTLYLTAPVLVLPVCLN